jgi:hypothetical protein
VSVVSFATWRVRRADGPLFLESVAHLFQFLQWRRLSRESDRTAAVSFHDRELDIWMPRFWPRELVEWKCLSRFRESQSVLGLATRTRIREVEEVNRVSMIGRCRFYSYSRSKTTTSEACSCHLKAVTIRATRQCNKRLV